MKTVYAEVFILDNTLINYYLLLLSGAVLGIKARRIYIVFAAAFGALYAFLQLGGFIPFGGVVLKTAVSFLMIYIGFKPSKAAFFRLLICFYGFSFLAAGAIVALLYASKTDAVLGRVVYLNTPMRFGLIIAAFAKVIRNRLFKIAVSLPGFKNRVFVTIPIGGEIIELRCFCDTGNCCTYMGKPVVFLNGNSIKENKVIKSVIMGNICKAAANINIVYIPFKSAGGTIHTAPGFKCGNAVFKRGEAVFERCVYFALTNHDFNGLPCLVNPLIFNEIK